MCNISIFASKVHYRDLKDPSNFLLDVVDASLVYGSNKIIHLSFQLIKVLRANPDNFCFQWEPPGLYYRLQLCMTPDQPLMNNIQRLKHPGEGNMSEVI